MAALLERRTTSRIAEIRTLDLITKRLLRQNRPAGLPDRNTVIDTEGAFHLGEGLASTSPTQK
jgi:hypothetical protein